VDARRYVRRSLATLAALALGAWLSLAALLLPNGGQSGPGTGWYLAVGAVGVCVVSIMVRWHALWLIPFASAAFAAAYQRWFWDKPNGISGGIDGIGYYPMDVACRPATRTRPTRRARRGPTRRRSRPVTPARAPPAAC
jgi:hypothetical protein